MNKVTCPFCGAIGEVDADLVVGQHVICPYCEKKFAYGEDNEAPDVKKEMFKFCERCGVKMSADTTFCPRCGNNVLGANEQSAKVGQIEEQNAPIVGERQNLFDRIMLNFDRLVIPTTDRLQNLFNMLRLNLVLSGITLLICSFDEREFYPLGRNGSFIIAAAFLGLGIWRCVAVMQLKSWARKTCIVVSLMGVLVEISGILSYGNLLVAVLNLAMLLIDIYCVYLCFTKEVASAFEPDSKLTDARLLANMMYCIGYWIATGLVIVATIVWARVYYGTDDWEIGCKEAAVAGSSSAREDLIEFYTERYGRWGATDKVDDIIKSRRDHPTTNARILHALGVLFAVLLGRGAVAKKKKK